MATQTKITFINEIAAMCERTGADVIAVSQGRGWTGASATSSCTQAPVRMGQDHSMPMQLTETGIKANDKIKRRMIDKVVDLCGGNVNDKIIAILGVSFKPTQSTCATACR